VPGLRRTPRGAPAARPPDAIPRSDGTVEGSDPDVVHFPFQAAFLTSVPSLYQPWDLQHLHLPEFFTSAQIERRELTYRAFCAQAKLVIAASGWVKRDLIEQYGVEPERIAVVGVPPPTRAYREPNPEESRDVRERHHLPDRFVFYPAQTWAHKNHARLFEALRLLRDAGLTVPLVCTGQLNASYPGLQALAAELGIDADVRFLGFVDPVVVKVLYESARALVFPSLYEGWGLPIVEAFSADLPVACSNVTSLPELVDDAALVFDPYDPADIAAAIRRLWTDDVLAAELARRGHAIADRYDWQRTAMIMRSHYRHVAGLEPSPEDLVLRAAAR
jgi:glycosyltransferase involved in cell wall biosynthesis